MSNFHKQCKTTQIRNSNDLLLCRPYEAIPWPNSNVKCKRDTTQKSSLA